MPRHFCRNRPLVFLSFFTLSMHNIILFSVWRRQAWSKVTIRCVQDIAQSLGSWKDFCHWLKWDLRGLILWVSRKEGERETLFRLFFFQMNHKPHYYLFNDLFLGPVCPYVLAPVARYSGRWQVPVLTTGGQANTFRGKDQYPLLTTVGGSYDQFAVFFKQLLHQFHWYMTNVKVVMLSSSWTLWIHPGTRSPSCSTPTRRRVVVASLPVSSRWPRSTCRWAESRTATCPTKPLTKTLSIEQGSLTSWKECKTEPEASWWK